MLKIIFLSLLGAVCSTAFCQPAHRDSLIKLARNDAKRFRLDDTTWKKYKHSLPFTSDHFKPRETDVKDIALRNDSVYVDAYRQAAFKSNKHRHTPWHYVLVGGSIAAGVVVLGIIGIIIFIAPTMG